MWKSSLECGSLSSAGIEAAGSTTVRMCRLLAILTLFAMNIHASSQVPPRLHSCRDIYKARTNEEYTFASSASCGTVTISLPVADNVVINVTDPRNCENFYKCIGLSCMQCPCPDGQTFNPLTLVCDSSNSACVCPVESTTAPATTTSTTTTVATTPSITTRAIVIQDAGSDKQNSDNNSKNEKPPVSTDVIIIAAIVSATAIIIVVIVMGVFCWQRRQTTHQHPPTNKPAAVSKQLSLSSKPTAPNDDAYSTSIPPTEKHEYAEIDERMVNSKKHWQHGGSLRAPPLPNHQPPTTSPMFSNTCPHHARSDSGLGSADTSFTANYPRRTFQPINPAHNIQIGVAYNERPSNSICQNCEEAYHGREDSCTSSESHYSNSSNPISVDSRDVDMRTPLHNCRQNYMSKQVYI